MTHWSQSLSKAYNEVSDYFGYLHDGVIPTEFPELDEVVAALDKLRGVLEIIYTASRVNSLRTQLEQHETKLAQLVGESQ